MMKNKSSSSSGNASSGSNSAGVSLQADLASLLTDKSQHDLKIVCSDNKEIGASRTILSIRSHVFRSMLSAETRDGQANKIFVAFKSSVMQIVLYFLYTDSVSRQNFSHNLAIEAYRAAIFFQLPKLTKLVVEQVPNSNDVQLLSVLLNEAIIDVPPGQPNKELYRVLTQPFLSRALKLGDLNKLTTEALKVVLQTAKSFHFQTNEHDLLLCIVEWAWARDKTPPSPMHRLETLEKLRNTTVFPENPEVSVNIVDEQPRASLRNMLKLIRIPLICPHRLAYIMASVDALAEMSDYTVPCEYLAAYSPIRCSLGHPSGYRGKPHALWASGQSLMVSSDGTIVELPCVTTIPEGNGAKITRNTRSNSVGANSSPSPIFATASVFPGIDSFEWLFHADVLADGIDAITSNPIVLGAGSTTFEWDIIIDSSGVRQTTSIDVLGIVGASSHYSNPLDRPSWYLICNGFHVAIAFDECQNKKRKVGETSIASPLKQPQQQQRGKKYGRVFGPGDVITFHLNGVSRTCSISINGTQYPVAFPNLPDKVYPAAKLWPNARYRLRTRF